MSCKGSSAFFVFTLIEIDKRIKIKRKKFRSKMPSGVWQTEKVSFWLESENQDERMSSL
jgi:uncharacterized membrane protein YgaE (UPF0421/DUF939 family)